MQDLILHRYKDADMNCNRVLQHDTYMKHDKCNYNHIASVIPHT